MQKEHRLSFCINLEVVILEVEIQHSFFGRIHDTIDCFQDLLTFRTLLFEFSSYYTTLQQCVKDMQYCEHDGIQETGHVCV